MIGIDLSQSSVKLVELQKMKGEKFSVKSSGVAEFGNQRLQGEAISFDEQVKALKNLKSKCGIKDKATVTLSLPNDAIFVRYLEILKSNKKKEQEFVHFEAKQQIPFPMEEVAWDFFYLDSIAELEKQAVLMAIKKELMEESVKIVEAANLKTKFVNLGLINLLSAAYANINFKKNETGILIDIGAQSSGIIIFKQGELWMRTLANGSDEITKEIADAVHVNLVEAEALKKEDPATFQDKEPEKAEKVREVIISNLVKIGDEIERSLEFFKSEQKRKKPELETAEIENPVLILSGGICSMDGIDDFFSSRLALPVRKLDLKRQIELNNSALGSVKCINTKTSFTTNLDFYHFFGVSIGAALSPQEKTPFRINFLRSKLNSKSQAAKGKWISILVKSCFLLAALIYLGSQVYAYQVNKQRMVEIDRVQDKFDQYKKQVVQIEQTREDFRRKGEFFMSFSNKRYYWLDLMNDIAGILPLNIWVEEMNLVSDLTAGGNDQFELKGYMLSYDDFKSFIDQIKMLGKVVDVVPEQIQTGEEQFSFTIKFELESFLDKESVAV